MIKRSISIFIVISTAILFLCFTKDGFTITGHITGYQDGTKVRLTSFEDAGKEKITTIKKNIFKFNGAVNGEAEKFVITIENGSRPADIFLIFIGNEDVIISADKKDIPYNIIVTGSKHQDTFNKLNKNLAIYEPDYSKTYMEYRLLRNIEDIKDSVQEVYYGRNGKLIYFEKKKDSIYRNFIIQNYNTYPGLEALLLHREMFDKKEVGNMYANLQANLKSSRYGAGLSAFLAKPQLKEGDIAYNFEAVDNNGKAYTLNNYLNNGKYVLLEIRKPICGASKMAIPILKQINDDIPNLQIVSLIIKDKESWAKNDVQIPYPSLFSVENSMFGKTVMGYDVHTSPTFFLLNPSGKIIRKFEGIDKDFKTQLNQYINNQ